MTWRAFILGLIFCAAISLLEPYVSHVRGWGSFSNASFPTGAVLVLVVLTVGLNVLLKLIRRGWELSQAELMLVWCMLIVALTFPGDAIERFWSGYMAGPPYMARRADIPWEESGGALDLTPDGIVLSTDPRSVAAQKYFQGAESGQWGRVPWGYWWKPLLHWGAFYVMIYLAVFFLMGILRRQWVESERLMFPLARVPLEFTEGSAGRGLLPAIFSERGFRYGLVFALAFRLLRAMPLIFGAESGWALAIPLRDIFTGTPLQPMDFDNIDLWPQAVGFAFLVPADVSLSIWFFYFFARMELQTASWLGLQGGGTYGPIMWWQQAGAYIALTLAMLYMARRHLATVARKALGLSRVDDSEEPVSYRVGFWGLVLSVAGCLGWYVYHGTSWLSAVLIFAMIMCWYMVYARMVAQAGLYVGRTIWHLPEFVHGITGGRVLGAPGAVISTMQDTILITGGTAFLSPMAINAFRISEVFKKRWRRLLLPILVLSFLVAMVCAQYTQLNSAYMLGAANFSDYAWAQRDDIKWRFDAAHRIITQPSQSAEPHPGPLLLGLFATGLVTFMRARFYWWPIHPIGLLSCSSWHAQRLWLPFLLGWMVKVGIMKFAGGRQLRAARYFFVALILVEAFAGGVSTVVRTLTQGAVPGF